MHKGKVVEYIDQGNFVITVCLQDEGGRLHLLTPANREMNLSPKRAFLVSDLTLNPLGPRDDLLNRLRQAERKRIELQMRVRVEELWALVEGESERLDHGDLAELAFGEKVTDDHISGLMRALFHDKTYFKLKDGLFVPNTRERIETSLREREEEALREEFLREGSLWLREILEKRASPEPARAKEVVEHLIEFVLHGEDAPGWKFTKELLARAGMSDPAQGRDLLVRLGIWEEDENLDLLRLKISPLFSDVEMEEARRVAEGRIDLEGREDLRDLPAFTIDGPFTRDFDDAIHIEVLEDSILLGVHVADVAALVPLAGHLDREAFHRGSSLYLPRRQIPMFPPGLSQDILSLRIAQDRPAISLLARFDKRGELQEWRFASSLIRVQRQLTYNDVNDLPLDEGPLAEAYRLSQILRQRRIERGALLLSLPEVSIQVGSDSSVSVEMIDQNTPSRALVAEFMILYNWLAARFCKEEGVPILYRGQAGPSEKLTMVQADYPYFIFKQRSKLSPLQIDPEPAPHTGLGLDLYTNASSPIRRYFDLVVQRQMGSALRHRPPEYSKDDLEKVRITLEPQLKELERVKRNRTRYWLLKYLAGHIGEAFSAVVLNVLRSRYRLLLTDFLLVAEMKRQNGESFSEGQRITVRVRKADPWNDMLRLEPVFNSPEGRSSPAQGTLSPPGRSL